MDDEATRGGAGTEAVGDSAELLRRIIEHNADGMVVVDGEGRVRFANEAAGRLFSREKEALLGADLGLPIVPGETTEVDVPGRGRARVAELRVVRMDWEGEPALLVSLRDITARREAEEQERALAVEQARRVEAEHREMRAAFRATIGAALEKSLTLGVNLDELMRACCDTEFVDWCAIDLVEDGGIARKSGSAGELDVLPSARAHVHASTSSTERMPADAARALGARLGGDWSDGWVLRLPLRVKGEPVGAMVLARRSRPFEEDDLEMAADVASRVAISIEHAQLYEEAQRAAHAKSQFLAVISHELRTPLNAVIGYSDLLLMDVAGEMTAQQKDLVGKVQTSSKHLLSLVEEILTYTRMERGQEELHVEDVTIGELASETIDLIEPMARASALEFRSDVEESQRQISTDPQKVRQVLTNLLTNAVKYTEEGHVALNVRGDAEGGVVFEVEDSGIGMTHEQIKHIYDPFWQVEPTNTRKRGGTGLGLTVAMELTRLLGGRLHVMSEPGAGTTFRLRLPEHAPQPAS